jgi:hypothetical protein
VAYAAPRIKPGRWWPSTAFGGVVFFALILLAVMFGAFTAGEQSRKSSYILSIAGIAGLTAYGLLTFWRNVYLSWMEPGGATTATAPAAGSPAANPSGQASSGGTGWKILSFIGMILVLALARGCSREIVKMLN